MKPLSCLFVLLGLLVLSVQKTGRCERGVDSSNLPCTGAGTFPIPGSCHSYYVCRPFGKSLFPYPAECDPGMIFDETSKECRPPSTVLKPSRCVTDVTSRTRRNVETAGSCPSLNGVSMCGDVNIVNRYSTRVISNLPLRESFISQRLSIIDAVNYNGDSERAMDNVLPWDNGDSILIDINKISKLATQYAMEFDRKYEVYEGKTNFVSSNQGSSDEAFMKMLRDNIRKLKEDIKASKTALKSADLPILKEYFKNNIKSLKQELRKKKQQIRLETSGDAKAASDLKELSHFTNFVKKDARDIEDLAKTTIDRVQVLLENLRGDSATFEDYNSAASVHRQVLSNNLTEEKQRYDEAMETISYERERLDQEIQDMENELKNLRDDIENMEVNMKKLEQEIEAKIDEYNATISTKCEDLGGLEQKTECVQANNSSPLDTDEETKEWDQLKDLILENRDKIISIYPLIELKKLEKDDLINSIPSTDSIEQVEAELGRLEMFLNDMEDLKGNLHSSLTSLSNIMKVLQGLECHFGGVAEQLTRLNAIVNAAENDRDKQAKKIRIEQDVSRVEAQIQQLSDQISKLKECA